MALDLMPISFRDACASSGSIIGTSRNEDDPSLREGERVLI